MATEFTGRGDIARSIALLWGLPGQARRGPKPSRSVDEVVQAAITLADSEGLAALSMRRVAESLGLSTMSLYTYVPSKAELIDLMLDRVAGESEEPTNAPEGWRARLEAIAWAGWRRAQRHPWVMDIGAHRPPLGPNILRRIETALRAIDGLGLDAMEMDMLTAVVGDFVRGSARAALEAREIEQISGVTDEQWWAANSELLKDVFEPSRYPTVARIGAAHKAARLAAGDGAPDRLQRFQFGLQRVLDGIEMFIAAKRQAP